MVCVDTTTPTGDTRTSRFIQPVEVNPSSRARSSSSPKNPMYPYDDDCSWRCKNIERRDGREGSNKRVSVPVSVERRRQFRLPLKGPFSERIRRGYLCSLQQWSRFSAGMSQPVLLPVTYRDPALNTIRPEKFRLRMNEGLMRIPVMPADTCNIHEIIEKSIPQ